MKGEWSRQTADNMKQTEVRTLVDLLVLKMVQTFPDGAENFSARWRHNWYRSYQVLDG